MNNLEGARNISNVEENARMRFIGGYVIYAR